MNNVKNARNRSAMDRDIVNSYETDCCTYFWEHVHKTISGQETMEELDSVIRTAMAMDMTEVVDAYNHSYQFSHISRPAAYKERGPVLG